jgi:nucleoside-diphosphate-sugar epimerase/putative flippase GtrA
MRYFIEKYQQNRDEVHRAARYLIIGGWNTLFGLGLYTFLYETFKQDVNYLVLTVPCNILAITNAFLCYKIFVFKTKGNWWREYWRCYLVYGGSALVGMGLMFILVSGCGIYPIIAQFMTVGISVAASYIGHRNFSFAKGKLFFRNKPLDKVLSTGMSNSPDIAKTLQGKTVFITGGTGFFGKWLLLEIDYLNRKYNAAVKMTVLSRGPDDFIKRYPEFAKTEGLSFLKGDVRNFEFPSEHFDYIIHGAAELTADVSDEIYSIIVDGTNRVLEFAKKAGVKRLLFISSGAVYGKQPTEIINIPESFLDSVDFTIPESAYGKAKYEAEKCCLENHSFETLIARPFAFVGPFLPLDGHFAAGNFIRNALLKQTLIINGDGTPLRSYMHSADMVNWLLNILLKGKDKYAYNVGSSQAVSILELAQAVADSVNYPLEIEVKKKAEPGQAACAYVPDTRLAEMELGLKQNLSLKESLKETINWYSSQA